MVATEVTPRVWIGCLAAYNAGRLHGEWVEATDADELEEARARILASSPVAGAEEHFIADHEGFGALIGEYSALEEVAAIGEALEEHGAELLAYAGHYGIAPTETGLSDLLESFEEARCGEWDSLEDFAQNLAEEIGAVSGEEPWPLSCVDWERAARELAQDYVEVDGFVFRCI